MKVNLGVEGLTNLRTEISALDQELFSLFVQRMDLISQVAKAKAEEKLPVFVQEREEQLRLCLDEQISSDMKDAAAVLLGTLLRLSRELQYDFLLDQDTSWSLGKALRHAERCLPQIQTVVFSGTRQSYAAQAAESMFPTASLVSVASFANACRQVVEENVDVAVLPLENSTAGTVAEVYSLLEKHTLYIQACFDLEIRHALIGLSGTKLGDIRRVASHPQALEQCSRIISGMGWETIEVKNTAYGAKLVQEQGDQTLAALASPRAALEDGLSILLPEASNTKCNQTRFIAVGRSLTLPPEAERVSLVLQTSNDAGALAGVLNVFADLGINLAKIQSRPIPNRPWDYNFHLDFWAKPNERRAFQALYQLEKEIPKVRFLGWYGSLSH